jgi:hypothetical protein
MLKKVLEACINKKVFFLQNSHQAQTMIIIDDI